MYKEYTSTTIGCFLTKLSGSDMVFTMLIHELHVKRTKYYTNNFINLSNVKILPESFMDS